MEIKPTKTHRVFLLSLDQVPKDWLIQAITGKDVPKKPRAKASKPKGQGKGKGKADG